MTLRIIARLDVKAPNLVKGVRLEGLRKLGNPAEFATSYYHDSVDEIYYQDIVASLYDRNGLAEIVRGTAEKVFVPLSVGGGIRSLEDIQTMLRAGADKVCINTAAVRDPQLITRAAEIFGVQCISVAIETIKQRDGTWLCFTDNGREHTGINAIDWAHQAVDLGAGEIFLTSVDREGTYRGCDTEFIEKLAKRVSVPVVAHGGIGTLDHIIEVAETGVDGIAIASTLHYKRLSIPEIKNALINRGIEVRL